jgi:hypothetical protein
VEQGIKMIRTLKKCEEIIISDSLYHILVAELEHREIQKEAQKFPKFNEFLKKTFVVLDKKNAFKRLIKCRKDFFHNLRNYLRVERSKWINQKKKWTVP